MAKKGLIIFLVIFIIILIGGGAYFFTMQNQTIVQEDEVIIDEQPSPDIPTTNSNVDKAAAAKAAADKAAAAKAAADKAAADKAAAAKAAADKAARDAAEKEAAAKEKERIEMIAIQHEKEVKEETEKIMVKKIKDKGLTNVIAKTKILSPETALQLAEWVTFDKPRLLYCGSVHGFTSDTFHLLCDKQTRLLSIYSVKYKRDPTDKEPNVDAIIGGYTEVGFTKSGGLVEDGKAFIFNLNTNTKFDVILRMSAVYDHLDYGPSFSTDIKSSLTRKTLSASSLKKVYDSEGVGLIGTKTNVNIIELEVWKVSSTPKEIELAIKEEKEREAKAAELARIEAERLAAEKAAADKAAMEKAAADKMEQRKLTNMVKTSKILNNITCATLTDFITISKEPVLLYNATTDGFKNSTYHTKCDNKGPCVTIFKLDNATIVGKYSSQSIVTKYVDTYDCTSFLFDLTKNKRYNVDKSKMKKLNLSREGDSSELTFNLDNKQIFMDIEKYNMINIAIPKQYTIVDMEVWQVTACFFNTTNEIALLKDSRLLSLDYIDRLLNKMKFNTMKLLYSSILDGFSNKTFHSKCDNKGATLTLYEINDGIIVGGYTSKSWKSKKSFIPDNKSFIFNLNKNMFYPVLNQTTAIYDDINNGPTFGDGYDLYINIDSKQGYVNPSSYNGELLGSSKSIVLKNVEVYNIITSEPNDVDDTMDILKKSKILGENNINKLMEWIYFDKPELLYSTSRDGFSNKTFHEKCDNRGPTLVVYRTKEDDVIGGYTTKSWTSGVLLDIGDKDAFIFNLITNNMYRTTQPDKSIRGDSKTGPSFGKAVDLMVNLDTKNGSANLGIYEGSLFEGRKTFSVIEVEVWETIGMRKIEQDSVIKNKAFNNSKILSNNNDLLLLNWFSVSNPILLYSASVDGFSNSTFHNKCDNKGTTIVLYKLNDGNVIGGYTMKSWKAVEGKFIEDPDAYIFNLTAEVKYKVVDKSNAIKADPKSGPSFGNGYDIYTNLDTKNGYVNPLAYTTVNEDEVAGPGVLGSGRKNITLSDVEVWRVFTPELSESAMNSTLKDSKILTEDDYMNVISWIINNRPILLYSGIKDGISNRDFHNKCDNKNPTMVLLKLADGNVIGGYTTKNHNNTSVMYVEDPNAFIFNVRSNTIIKVTDAPNALKQDPKSGINFGYDIIVNLDTKSGQTTPVSYLGPDNIGVLGTGRKTITIVDIEVWQVPEPKLVKSNIPDGYTLLNNNKYGYCRSTDDNMTPDSYATFLGNFASVDLCAKTCSDNKLCYGFDYMEDGMCTGYNLGKKELKDYSGDTSMGCYLKTNAPDINLAMQFQNNFTYQNNPSGGNQSGLVWTTGCSAPWDTKYIIGCEKDGQTMETPELGPVNNYNWQGPKIRISPDGMTECAKQGGLVKIKRNKNNKGWVDITDKVKGFGGNNVYDRKDAIFYDDYGIDCLKTNPPNTVTTQTSSVVVQAVSVPAVQVVTVAPTQRTIDNSNIQEYTSGIDFNTRNYGTIAGQYGYGHPSLPGLNRNIIKAWSFASYSNRIFSPVSTVLTSKEKNDWEHNWWTTKDDDKDILIVQFNSTQTINNIELYQRDGGNYPGKVDVFYTNSFNPGSSSNIVNVLTTIDIGTTKNINPPISTLYLIFKRSGNQAWSKLDNIIIS